MGSRHQPFGRRIRCGGQCFYGLPAQTPPGQLDRADGRRLGQLQVNQGPVGSGRQHPVWNVDSGRVDQPGRPSGCYPVRVGEGSRRVLHQVGGRYGETQGSPVGQWDHQGARRGPDPAANRMGRLHLRPAPGDHGPQILGGIH